MKNLMLVTALSLISLGAFANEAVKPVAAEPAAVKISKKEAVKACKSEGKTKKDLAPCVKAKLNGNV
jgi:hypothetical protein